MANILTKKIWAYDEMLSKRFFSRETESNRRPKDHRKFPLQSSALPTELSRVNCFRDNKIAGQQAATGQL